MPKTTDNPRPTRIHKTWRTNVLVMGFSVLAIAALSTALHWRAQAYANPVTTPPLPVSVMRYQVQDHYQRDVSYLGLVEAGRKAELGFESGGLIAALLVREGQPVIAGTALARLDTADLDARRRATEADLERVRSELQLAQLKAQRQQNLSDSGAVSQEAFDETRLRAQALTAQVDSVKALLSGLDIALAKSVLRAPFAGSVARRHLDEGVVVAPGTPVLRLVETARREARIGIPVNRAEALQSGGLYTLTLRKQPIKAQLLSLLPDIDPRTRTLTAVFEIPADTAAMDGEAITLQLQQQVEQRGGWLPLTALQEGQRGAWTVLRVDAGEAGRASVVREAVEVLDTRGEMAFVRGTLANGQQVIDVGVHRVAPGERIEVVER